VAAHRVLPPYAKQRFSTWWRQRPVVVVESPRASASVFPTCFIEYMEPDIGKDLVRVYERNKVACSLPAGTRCCGAPWLHSGDVRSFTRQAERNLAALAAEARAGRDIVVAQPTCAYVIRKDYPIYVGGAEAELVSSHAYDACEYLVRMHGRNGGLDTDFAGDVPEKVVYHNPCHLRAQNIGMKSRDLLQLTGASVSVVERCSGIDGSWGYRAENYELARKVAAPLRRAIEAELPAAVCGDCHLANGAIREETGVPSLHPLQLVARAYGISEEDSQ
jgi:Fe-S oxidoreductase